jgi:hypothetical protein
MATRELRLFGQPVILGPDRATPIRLKRRALLLAMLASTPDGIERATLAERLWEEGDDASRLRRLRRLVFEARGLLGADALPEQGARLALSGAWRAHCDVARYLQQYHSLIHHGGTVSAPVSAFDIVQAARAPLLGDWAFDERTPAAEWLDFQRTAQSSRCRRMRDRIVASLLALLLIPGFVSNVEMAWEQPQLATFLARAAREFRVILFDRRGVGLSDRTLENPSMPTAVSDVLAVLDAAGSTSAVVFGASEGGPVAIQLCCAHPRRVRALRLYAALPKGTASASYGAALTSQQYDLWRERLVAD